MNSTISYPLSFDYSYCFCVAVNGFGPVMNDLH